MAAKTDWVDGDQLTAVTMNALGAQIDAKQPGFMTGTIATASATAAKTVTLNAPWAAAVPAAGDFYLLTYTSGCTSSSTTVSINGSAAFSIRLAGTTPASSTAHTTAAGGALLYYFDGTTLNLIGSQLNIPYASAATANFMVQRDANANAFADVFAPTATSTATAAGTTALTNNSTQVQVFTGTTTQTVTLPTTSIAAGWPVVILNTSTGAVTINASGGTLVATVAAGKTLSLMANQATPTTSAHWSILSST